MENMIARRLERMNYGNTSIDASFPISIDYCNHWELWQSIREIVANCFDAIYEFLYKKNIDPKSITVNKA
jgi:hypothetical protein